MSSIPQKNHIENEVSDFVTKFIREFQAGCSSSAMPVKKRKYLLEHRPSKDMSDEKLATLAPWNETVQELCSNKTE